MTNHPGTVVRVMIVEDDPVVAEANAAHVRRVAGFEVVAVVGTGADALRTADSVPVDLALLDVHLPDGSGLDVLRRLRAAGHTADVIMVTRARDLAVVQAAVALGATQYLVKPFTAATVRTKLEAHLAYRARLAGGPVVAQADVDELLGAVRGGPVDAAGLPKGISREPLSAVGRALTGAVPAGLTASEVASLLGASRITARRYLEYLADAGLAGRHHRYGGTGRPQVEYRATGRSGREMTPGR